MAVSDDERKLDKDDHDAPPEPFSINDILRRYCRERLYVRPLHWTSRHLALLECRFQRTKHKLSSFPQSRLSEEQLSRAGQLRKACLARTSIIDDLLGYCNLCCRYDTRLSFHFGQRQVASLETDGIFLPVLPQWSPPRLAYLEVETIRRWRDRSIPIPRCTQPNPPVIRLKCKRQERLQPADEAEDPYIAAVLIALAQAQYRRDPASADFKVHLLTMRMTKPRRLTLYTASIPSRFLDRFDQPSQQYPSSPVVITYIVMPLKPEYMLRAMQFALLDLSEPGKKEAEAPEH